MIDYSQMITKEEKEAKAVQSLNELELASLDKTIYGMMASLIDVLLSNNTLKGNEQELLPLYQAVSDKKAKEAK